MAADNLVEAMQKKILEEIKKGGEEFAGGLTPGKLLILLGILANVFEIEFISFENDQSVHIGLEGSLRRKDQLDKTLDFIGEKSFEEVLQAFLRRM